MKNNINHIKTADFEHACMLNLHACVLNRLVFVLNLHAVRYGNNATQSVDSTRMRVIVCLNGRSYLPAA
jgi:hypothetical protein